MAKYEDDYTRVTWKNLPSHDTPINQQNLNNMDEQIKKLTTRVSDMSEFTPSVRYVDTLPEQGVEGIFYVESIIEHGFELTGLPNRYKSQSALDEWINDGNFAFMLHLKSNTAQVEDTYVIIENVLVSTITSVPDVYTVSEINGDVSAYYRYFPNTQTWDSMAYYGLSVGDSLVAFGLDLSTSTKIGNQYYAVEGAISETLGIENIIGDMTITMSSGTHSPTVITYSDDDNTYEIYQAKPIQVISPKNVYLWSDDANTFFGFQVEYEEGENITFTKQGTKTIISADVPEYTEGTGIDIQNDTISVDTSVIQEKLVAGQNITIRGNVISASGGGGGSSWVAPIMFETYPDDECSITYAEFKSLYNTYGGALPIFAHAFGASSSFGLKYFPMSEIYYFEDSDNVNNQYYKIYFDASSSQANFHYYVILTFKPDESVTQTYSYAYLQEKLSSANAGDGISISSSGVISVNYPNGDSIEY